MVTPSIRWVLFLAASWIGLGSSLWAQPGLDGEVIFQSKCSGCHSRGQENVPTRDQLALRPQFAIIQALDSGKMRLQGDALSAAERRAVAMYLSQIDTKVTDSSQNNKCAALHSMTSADLAGWNGWGIDPANTRYKPKRGSMLVMLQT